MNLWNGLLKGIGNMRDIAVPPLCLICEAIAAEPGGCCPACWKNIRFISPPFCAVTGAPFSHDQGEGIVSADAIANPPPYDRCRSVVVYNDDVRKLVTGFKYSDRLDLAPWLANWMVAAGNELLQDRPILVPVPLYTTRLIQRRYNQSSELARLIALQIGLEFRPDILARIRRTRQQVGLSGKERERNVQGAFRVREDRKAEVIGRRFLIVDDVYTSGATVKAAARSLKRAGAGQVDVLTFARVDNVE